MKNATTIHEVKLTTVSQLVSFCDYTGYCFNNLLFTFNAIGSYTVLLDNETKNLIFNN